MTSMTSMTTGPATPRALSRGDTAGMRLAVVPAA